MLFAFFVIVMIMWFFGMVSTFTLSGFVHILLILAIGAILIRIVQGRRL